MPVSKVVLKKRAAALKLKLTKAAAVHEQLRLIAGRAALVRHRFPPAGTRAGYSIARSEAFDVAEVPRFILRPGVKRAKGENVCSLVF